MSGAGHSHDSTAEVGWDRLGAAVLVGIIYYGGAKIGLALTFEPYPIAVLWPPNALLLAALLLVRTSWWWILILGAFPAHLLAELQGGVPLTMVLGWYVSNVTEAVIGAAIVRRFAPRVLGLGTVRAVSALCAGAFGAALLSSFLDAAFVRLLDWGRIGYWDLWQARIFTNLLATLIFVPVVLSWAAVDPAHIRHAARARLTEAVILVAGLLAVSVVVFDSRLTSHHTSMHLLYLPMPFLVWAALRFGPPITSACFAIVSFLVIWGAAHGRGPFMEAATHDSALPIQLFLLSVGVPLLFLAAVIEERRSVLRSLRASEKRFATAFRAVPDAIAISRRSDGRVIDANDQWLRLFAYGAEALEHGKVAPLVEHTQASHRGVLARAVNSDEDAREIELALHTSKGEQRHAVVSMSVIELDGEPCHITILRDVTEQRRAGAEAREQRQQLTHLTRVASLTDFSGALAHELNQPLTAILSNAQAAQRFLARDPPNIAEIRAILADIAEADKRAGLLIHRLRLMMKKAEEEFRCIDLNVLVAEMLDFARGEFVTNNVEVASSFCADVPQVNADPVQLQQLLLNLVSNACEAMQCNGNGAKRLSIVTRHGSDGTAQIVVSDNGPGIATERMEQIFEPFYTSRENGLGLGLAICRTIARTHGGSLNVDPHFERGASFRLVLPAADGADRTVRARRESAQSGIARKE